MSIESFNQFQKEVTQDSVLQEQINSAGATSPESFGNLVVKLGAERGYSFTLEEVQAAMEVASDAELESVAGGIPPLVAPLISLISTGVNVGINASNEASDAPKEPKQGTIGVI